MEATRERPRDSPAAAYAPTTFDPDAVPQAYSFPATAQRAGWEQFESDDLISLGEEQLFSGARTQAATKVDTRNGRGEGALQASTTPIVSEVRSSCQFIARWIKS